MERLALSPADLRSDLLRRLVAHWRGEQQALRERNDSKTLDPVETAFLRGRLAQIKEDLALGAPPFVTKQQGIDDDADL